MKFVFPLALTAITLVPSDSPAQSQLPDFHDPKVLKMLQRDYREIVLDNYGSKEVAIKHFAQMLESKSVKEREEGAHALGSTGWDETLPHLKNALADADPNVVKQAINGLWSTKPGWVSAKMKNEVFQATLPLLGQDWKQDMADTVHNFAMHLDREKTVAELLGERYWRKDNPKLLEILRLLMNHGIKPPVEKVRSLVSALLPQGKEPADWSRYIGGLHFYAFVAPQEAEPVVQAALKEAPASHRDGVTTALGMARGLPPDLWTKIIDRMGKREFAQLSRVEQIYYALFNFTSTINASGEAGFFEPSDLETWNMLRVGANEIGANETVKLLDAWSAVFPGAKPGEKGFDFDESAEAYEKKTGKNLLEELERVAKAWAKGKDILNEEIPARLEVWAAEHAAEFVKTWAEQK